MTILRLADLDSAPESVLCIVRFFDDLPEDADEILRAARELAGCEVRVQGCEPTLERNGTAHPLDSVLLDRLRYRLTALPVSAHPRLGDPALVEVVLSDKERPADRARAIRLLGLDETRAIRVLAISASSTPQALRVINSAMPDTVVRSAALGTAIAVLCQGHNDIRALSDRLDQATVTAFPAPLPQGADRGPWVGIGADGGVFAAPESWNQALRALQFASSTGFGRRAVAYERLSALDLLAELRGEALSRNPLLQKINRIAETEIGRSQVDTVEAFCVFGSLRRTAEELHVHHSTVGARLARIEAELGWDLDDPLDRFSATLVLMLRRMALSSAELDR